MTTPLEEPGSASFYFVIEPVEGAVALGLATSRQAGEDLADRLRVERSMGAWSQRYWSEIHPGRIWGRRLTGGNGYLALEVVRLEVGEPQLSRWLAAVESGRPSQSDAAHDELLAEATSTIHAAWDDIVDDALRADLGAVVQVVNGLRDGEQLERQETVGLLRAVAASLRAMDTSRYPARFVSGLAEAVDGLASALGDDDVDAAVASALAVSVLFRDHGEFLAWLQDR